MKEIWKDISGYEGLYQVSTFGRVKSIRKNLILSQSNGTCGYRMVNLYVDKKQSKKLVHRLVAQTFIENPLEKEQVNHIDGNKNNNNLSNLEWSTRSENVKHAYLIGIKEPTEKVRAAAQKLHAIPILVTNRKTGEERAFPSGRQAANYFNVKPYYFYKLLRTNGKDNNFAIKKQRGESSV
ncbi:MULTISPECIES: NUMOD4 domain-containing protein [Enterococcus]|uniref:NUMOD4 domain-containing protein n=1 Tax=Enterococcus TaxID=1350 RepID=UPI00288C78F5|nr:MULTISPECIES: NUMOD4 domain-containing protein [Enterococcus]MDT2485744.1 NUMOD4 domain-containing protein [Enterococcus avium]MDT2512341.1 NUMOD4 domain-containing protein [Enterococcus avium]MDT2673327.1 NUMOD4 domain-containing protein [Enterococcus dongliensis]